MSGQGMLRWLKTYWRNILLLAVVWLVFECWISWAAFCDQPHYEAGQHQSNEEYSCQFRGPVFFAAQSFRAWWRETFDKADAYVALFTAVLAVSTIFLWVVTKTAADAGKESADALTSAERPHLLVSQLNARINLLGVSTPEDKVVPINYTFEVRNFGRSPAFMGNYIFQFHYGVLPDEPQYDELWRDQRNIIVPHRWFKTLSELKIADVPVDDVIKIRDGEMPAYIFGVLEYKGIFKGKTHKLRFCYRMVFANRALESVLFQPEGPDSYWEYA